MKTLLCIPTILLAASAASCQGVTIGNEPVHVEYYRLPDEPLNPAYKTYSAEVDAPLGELSKVNLTETTLVDDYLELAGYQKVSRNGDIEIEAEIGQLTIWGEHRDTRRSKSKDKDGNEKVKITYALELRYSVPVAFSMETKDGKTLEDQYILSHGDIKTWTSHSYSSLADLDSYWRINRKTKIAELHRNLLLEGMDKIRKLMNARYGYQLIEDQVKFETIGKKKHPDYEKYLSNLGIIQNAFKLMDANKGLEDIRQKIRPALAFYKTEEAKYKASSKDGARLKHICLYNLALANLWTEDFEAARNYAQAIQKFDPKDRDAKRVIEEIDYVMNSLQVNNRKSRHMVNSGRS